MKFVIVAYTIDSQKGGFAARFWRDDGWTELRSNAVRFPTKKRAEKRISTLDVKAPMEAIGYSDDVGPDLKQQVLRRIAMKNSIAFLVGLGARLGMEKSGCVIEARNREIQDLVQSDISSDPEFLRLWEATLLGDYQYSIGEPVEFY